VDRAQIGFRALRRDDFELLARWLAEPLVARWWNHDTSPDAVERDFGASVDGRDATELFVALLAGRPFGLIQRYPIAAYPEYLDELSQVCAVLPNALSIDYLVGESELRGRGVGAAMIAAFVSACWAACREASAIVVPVATGNLASWRALERAGFDRIAEGELEPDNPRDGRDHYVYAIRRPAGLSGDSH
jgi:aminoglycoside 6'-N-acetyltransferase